MRTPGFATFFTISLCIHFAGATAFVVNSKTEKRAENVVKVKLIKEAPKLSSTRFYTEVDLTQRALGEEEITVDAKIASWISSKSHLPKRPDPLKKQLAPKNTLLEGSQPNAEKPLRHPASQTSKRGRGVKNDIPLDNTSKKNSRPEITTSPLMTAETIGNTPYVRPKASKDNLDLGDDKPISLETTKVEYMGYFQKIQQKIDEAWEYPAEAMLNGDSGDSEINFQIANDGTVKDASVLNSSGSETLDKGSVKAVIGAAPFPPIPLEVGRTSLNIVATFRYSMNFGAGN